nr:carboxymuconolactone decarboxylase family protein [Gluconobacter albidus]
MTVSALVSMYRLGALETHLKIALDHGVTREELSSTTTHLGFYAGGPSAASSIGHLRKVLEDLSPCSPYAFQTGIASHMPIRITAGGSAPPCSVPK